jgi:hypothetical protein
MRLVFSLFPLVLACAACGSPEACAKDPAQCQDAGSDGPDGPGSCTGTCAPHAPVEWLATSLVWIGAQNATTPACPAVMTGTSPAFADTPPTVSCPTCACSPSSGKCLLPAQLSANPSACPGGPGAQPFNPPTLWDGTCTAMDPVSSADSLTVMPPQPPAADYCLPVKTGPVSITGNTPALVCSGLPSVAPGTCGDQSMVCAFPKESGFLTCITRPGDQQCPDGWPTRHLLFFNDQACGCQCESPVGDSCSATVTVYNDGACSQPLGSVMVSSDQPKGCVDVPPGSAFASKSSTPPDYKAGTCTPMSFDEGAPLTACCLP